MVGSWWIRPKSCRVSPSAPFDLGVASVGWFARLGCSNRRGTPQSAPVFDLVWLVNLTRSQRHGVDLVRFEASSCISIDDSGTVPRRFGHPSLANGRMETTPGSNGADERALCGTACPERRVPNAAPADRRPWCESQEGRRASARRVSHGHGPPWTVPNHGCRRTVRSSARGGSRSAPRRASVTANLPGKFLGQPLCHYRKKTFLVDTVKTTIRAT